jgi:hypothetical protein
MCTPSKVPRVSMVFFGLPLVPLVIGRMKSFIELKIFKAIIFRMVQIYTIKLDLSAERKLKKRGLKKSTLSKLL